MEQRWLEEERLFVNVETAPEGSGSGRRYFSRGGVKFALLQLLAEQSMHGYQMMKALEEQSGGLYKPSAGTIYPTLQMLRDQEFIVAVKEEDKQVFSITDKGLELLERKKHHSHGRHRAHCADDQEQPQKQELQDVKEEIEQKAEDEHRGGRRLTPVGRELIHLLKAAERTALSDGDKAVQLRFILHQLRNSLYELVEGEGEE